MNAAKRATCNSAVLALALVLAIGTPNANAYEEDVHFGLTYWLALRAGFSNSQGERIAAANVEYDHSALSATKIVISYACFGSDRKMSRMVKKIHFPSAGNVPGEPAQRSVQAGSDEAYRAVRARLASPSKSEDDNIDEFGEALHPLQDSWSHQGVPGSPLGKTCKPLLSWGHPDARGGWRRHDADLTHLYVQDTVAMAQATYLQLCAFREKLHGEQCKDPFEAFSADIIAFARAATKQDKARWFNEHDIKSVAFLDATTIPNGGSAFASRHEPLNYETPDHPPVPPSRLAAVPETEEGRFMKAFFQAWATDKDMSDITKTRVALSAYREQMGQGTPRQIDPGLVYTQLMFWRVRDHGSLAQTAAGVHDLLELSPAQLAEVSGRIRQADAPYPSADAAFLPFDQSGLPIVTWTSQQPGGRKLYFGAARFRHAPKDLVFVIAESINGEYKVVSLSSVLTE